MLRLVTWTPKETGLKSSGDSLVSEGVGRGYSLCRRQDGAGVSTLGDFPLYILARAPFDLMNRIV